MAEQFLRIATVNLAGREFSSPPFSLEFSVEFVSASTPATAEIVLRNVSDDTVAAAEKRGKEFPRLTLTAGYQNDSGIVMLGNVIESVGAWEGPDRTLKLKVMDSASVWNTAFVSLSYSTPTPASVILSALLAKAGIVGAQIQPANNKVFDRYSVNCSFRDALLRLAKDTGSEVFARQGQIYFRSPSARDSATAIVIEPEEIIGEVQKTSTGVRVRTLFNHRFAPGVFVDLQSKRQPGLYRVKKAKLSWSDSGDAGVEWEGVAA